MRKSLLSLGILCSIGLTLLQAQDPSFSQFYANRIYLIPAFTGFEAWLTVGAVSRMQWLTGDGGFRTYGFTLELQEPHLSSGIGLSLFRDQQGLADLETTSIGLSYAYIIPFDRHNIHIGIQGHYVQRTIDWTNITFSDQLDPLYGAIYPTAAVPILDRVAFTDFDFGFVWRFDSDINLGKKRFKDARHSLGMSLHHAPSLFNPDNGNESFQNLDTRVSPRLTVHMGSVIPIWFFSNGKKNISISPNFKYDIQGDQLLRARQNLVVTTLGCYLIYDGVYVGALYQNKQPAAGVEHTNALILAVGTFIEPKTKARTKKNQMFIGLSYDANATGVGARAGGVLELAFRWNFSDAPGVLGGKKGRSSKRAMDCHKFF